MRTGDKVLNYNVTRRIKAGGMGVVFEGEQTWGSRRKVAIKQLLENLRDDVDIRRRFIREAEILEMLDNSRIVKILGFDHEQDAFVMEFVEGKTLADVLKEDLDRFRQPDVLVTFFTRLLDAFAYAHDVVLTINGRTEKGIVHRDIKPSNIIIQPDGDPKILDFGISRIASFQSTLTDPKLQMGSVPYMSPEQIATPTDVDWRSDIYSLGVTLWEMMTGRSPYPRVTTHEVVVEVQRQIRFEMLPSLLQTVEDSKSRENSFLQRLDQIIVRATMKDRANRYQHCDEMKMALQQALADWHRGANDSPAASEEQTVVRQEPDEPARPQPRSEPPPPVRIKPADADADPTPVLVQVPATADGTFPPVVASRRKLSANKPARQTLYLALGIGILLGGSIWWYKNRARAATPVTAAATDTTVATESTLVSLAAADSCIEVGNNYYTGQSGKTKDMKQAAYWYQRAADLGNSDGQNALGLLYQFGQGVTKDYGQAVKWFRASADQGNAEGQKNLGYMYYLGLGTGKDYLAALKWFRASADQGNADSRATLGIMYEQGLGVAASNEEAMKWYQRAANQDFPRAQYYVGTMYASGKGVSRSEVKAVQWYQLAARQGDASARQELHRLGQTW